MHGILKRKKKEKGSCMLVVVICQGLVNYVPDMICIILLLSKIFKTCIDI